MRKTNIEETKKRSEPIKIKTPGKNLDIVISAGFAPNSGERAVSKTIKKTSRAIIIARIMEIIPATILNVFPINRIKFTGL